MSRLQYDQDNKRADRCRERIRGIVYQHDSEMLMCLSRMLGLGTETPRKRKQDVTEGGQSRWIKIITASTVHKLQGVLFLSQDRADTTCIVNYPGQKMADPDQQSMAKLRRLVTYLERERQ